MRGEEEIDEEELSGYVEPMPGEPTADLDTLDEKVETVVDEHSRFDTSMDKALAEDIHRCQI
ncbi:hypothetical protein ACFQS4_02105 [Saliphagus sp. GCM10025317]